MLVKDITISAASLTDITPLITSQDKNSFDPFPQGTPNILSLGYMLEVEDEEPRALEEKISFERRDSFEWRYEFIRFACVVRATLWWS